MPGAAGHVRDVLGGGEEVSVQIAINILMQNDPYPTSSVHMMCPRYVEEDLKKGLGKEPAKVLSARPMDDPLEIIMYLTRSVLIVQ